MPKAVRKMQKANAAAQAAVYTEIPAELLDQLVKGPMTAKAVEDISRSLKKTLIERALGAELSHHLSEPDSGADPAKPNHRNGNSAKTVLTDEGPLRIAVPRDRAGEFEPRLIVTGNSFTAPAAWADISRRYRRRHLNTKLALIWCFNAIVAAEAPGDRLSRTSRCLNSLL